MGKYEDANEAVRDAINSFETKRLSDEAFTALLYYIRELETRLYALEQKPEPYDYFRPIG